MNERRSGKGERGFQEARKAVRVLLAEDDKWKRCLLAAALTYDGHVVVEVENAVEALEYLADTALRKATMPDVVVSEVRLPVLTGVELLARVRRSVWAVPVILIDASSDPEVLTRAQRLGVAAMLTKPIDVDDLRAAVSRVVASH